MRGTYSKSKDLLDDIVTWKDMDWWLAYYDKNPNEVRRPLDRLVWGYWFWELTNFSEKRRDYKSIEVEINGRVAEKFWINASYVWSQAKGTNPGQFDLGSFASTSGSSYDIGVFGDHVKIADPNNRYYYLDEMTKGLGGVETGDEGWYGLLPYSVDHNIENSGDLFRTHGIRRHFGDRVSVRLPLAETRNGAALRRVL